MCFTNISTDRPFRADKGYRRTRRGTGERLFEYKIANIKVTFTKGEYKGYIYLFTNKCII